MVIQWEGGKSAGFETPPHPDPPISRYLLPAYPIPLDLHKRYPHFPFWDSYITGTCSS